MKYQVPALTSMDVTNWNHTLLILVEKGIRATAQARMRS